MTHLWLPGLPVALTCDGTGLPLRFTWQGRTHTVIAHANHWRVVWGWWRWPVERDTFKVVTDTGLLVELAYDRLTGQWSLQRLYD